MELLFSGVFLIILYLQRLDPSKKSLCINFQVRRLWVFLGIYQVPVWSGLDDQSYVEINKSSQNLYLTVLPISTSVDI